MPWWARPIRVRVDNLSETCTTRPVNSSHLHVYEFFSGGFAVWFLGRSVRPPFLGDSGLGAVSASFSLAAFSGRKIPAFPLALLLRDFIFFSVQWSPSRAIHCQSSFQAKSSEWCPEPRRLKTTEVQAVNGTFSPVAIAWKQLSLGVLAGESGLLFVRWVVLHKKRCFELISAFVLAKSREYGVKMSQCTPRKLLKGGEGIQHHILWCVALDF